MCNAQLLYGCQRRLLGRARRTLEHFSQTDCRYSSGTKEQFDGITLTSEGHNYIVDCSKKMRKSDIQQICGSRI